RNTSQRPTQPAQTQQGITDNNPRSRQPKSLSRRGRRQFVTNRPAPTPAKQHQETSRPRSKPPPPPTHKHTGHQENPGHPAGQNPPENRKAPESLPGLSHYSKYCAAATYSPTPSRVQYHRR